MQLMPSYYHESGGVGLEIQTPWAGAAAKTQQDWQQGIGAFNIEGMKKVYSGKLHVWVATTDPLSSATVSIEQAGKTFSPSYTFDPLPKAQGFDFEGLDKSLPVTVTAVVNGQQYSHTWELADLK